MPRPLTRFLKVEQLEDRATPAVFNGTAGIDRFFLSPFGETSVLISRYGTGPTLLGQAVVTDDSNQLNGLGGNDVVSVDGVLPLAFAYDGGNGNDVIFHYNLTDAVISDLGDNALVTITGKANFTFSDTNVEQFLAFGTGGNDTFSVNLGPSATSLVFNGLGGNDTVNLYNADNVTVGDAGAVVKVDRVGSGTIFVNDGDVESLFLGGTSGNDRFALGPIPDYTSVTFYGGVGTDVATVYGVHSATATDLGLLGKLAEEGKAPVYFNDSDIEQLTLYGTTGDDNFNISAPDTTLFAIHGGGGRDSVAVVDLHDATFEDFGNYSVVGDAGNASVFISDADVEAIYLFGTSANDLFDIVKQTDYADVAVLGGDGSDTIYVRNLTTATIDMFPGYGVVTRTGTTFGALFFSDADVESLYLLGTAANDTYEMSSRPQYTAVAVIGAGGFDVMNIYQVASATVTDFGDYGTVEGPGGSTVFVSDTNLERLNLRGTPGDDFFNLSTYLSYTQIAAVGDDGNDTLTGGSGNDILEGGNGDDVMMGNGGNDTMIGGDGDDQFFGGSGTDVVFDEIPAIGTLSDVTFFSGIIESADHEVEDWEFTSADSGVIIDASLWTRSDLVIFGGAGSDFLLGGSQADTISGGTGVDTLSGNGGNDNLDGGADDDEYYGGDGFDTVRDEVPNTANLTDTTFTSGIYISNNHEVESWSFTSSDNGVTIDGSSWTQNGLNMIGGAGNDTFFGGTENDVLDGRGGNDRFLGGAGNDFVDDLIPNSAVLTDTSFNSGGVISDPHSIENWTFTSGDSGVSINASAWTVNGITMTGGNGGDTLIGGTQSDLITGGGGDDSMTGGDGYDQFYGEGGNDSVNDLIPFLANLSDTSFTSGFTSFNHAVENWTFTSSNIGVTIDCSAWTGNGLSITGGTGKDVLTGGSGNDTISGGDGYDTLYGRAGNDTLLGGNGNDGLIGGTGINLLTGGAGKDRYPVLIRAGVITTITDLVAEDARITFQDTAVPTDLDFEGFAETFQFDAASWSENEIVQVDTALANLHAATNNTTLLRHFDGTELTFIRYGTQLTFTNVNVWNGYNEDNGRLGLMTTTVNQGVTAIYRTVYREMGHNWDTPDENMFNGTAFYALSSWIEDTNDPGSNYTPSTGVDDDWWFFNTSIFARDFAKLNPFEDYATTWETYFTDFYHGLGASGNFRVTDKLDNVIAFIVNATT